MLYFQPYYSYDLNKILQTMNIVTQISVPVNAFKNKFFNFLPVHWFCYLFSVFYRFISGKYL